tara:strand:- start:2668 stop:2994 length:327 start_codon:yes stop_codon:yes gene_type:complete
MVTLTKTKYVLKINGKLTSKNVSETQKKIEYALTRYNNLTINISGIEKMDISGVFMLYLIKKTAVEKQKRVSLSGLNNKAFKNALKTTGVSNLFITKFCTKYTSIEKC